MRFYNNYSFTAQARFKNSTCNELNKFIFNFNVSITTFDKRKEIKQKISQQFQFELDFSSMKIEILILMGPQVVFILLISSVLSENPKLNVDIYFESECKYSKIFFQQQVKPVYELIKESVRLTFIPFGKSRSILENSEITFQCQHGKAECIGNMIIACVLSFFPQDYDRQFEFICCAMGYEKTKIHCAEDVGVNEDRVQYCMENEGINFQLKNEIKTIPVITKSRHIPTIIFDEEFNPDDDYAAIGDFYAIVKRKLNEKN